ncbi:MAG: hypothetical protein NC133_02820 [Prevotella sp.]|nr:hypothetical protein [Prevotella sp.]
MTTDTMTDQEIFAKRVRADERLDALYMREMRCPYCHTKIMKGTAKCENCALTKEQIYHAKLTAPYRPGQNILYSKVRPASLPLWKMGLGGVFGFLGLHCFFAKRYLRGIIILCLLAAYITTLIIFPPAVGDSLPNATRYLFESKTYLFPGDLLGIVTLGMWVWDLFAIFLGQFKYPVVVDLGENA